jgi:membrane protein
LSARRAQARADRAAVATAVESGLPTQAKMPLYGILAIFPALLMLVSILGVIGPSATQPLIDNLGSVAPGPAKDIVTSALRNLQKSQGAAGAVFVLALAIALWSSSQYVAAFMRASNAIHGVEEGRPLWKTLPTRLLLTLVLLLMVAALAVAVTFTGPLAKEVGNILGVGSAALTLWGIAKWPLILLGVMTIFALLHWGAPTSGTPSSAGSAPEA